jgi:hypothetical protein
LAVPLTYYAHNLAQNGSLLVSIPKDYLFTTNTVLSHPQLGRIIKKSFESHAGTPLSAIEALSLGILFFKSNPSTSDFWTLYLDSIPKQYDSLIFWSQGSLKFLGSSNLESRVERRKSKILDLFQHTLDTLKKHIDSTRIEEVNCLNNMTIGAFQWAYATIMSRSVFVADACRWNNVDVALQKDTAALPPLLDFFNHSNETECSAGYSSKTQCYELRTNQNWNANSQVFIKYGCHSNSTLLMHYGFVISDNVYDSIRLDFDFNSLIGASSDSELKLTKLYAYGLISPQSVKKTGKSVKHELSMDGIGWNTMVAIKTMLMTTNEEISNWDRLLEDVAVSEDNERRYRDYCRSLYQKMLTELDIADKLAQKAPEKENHFILTLSSTFREGRRSILIKAIRDLDSSSYP